MPDINLSLYYTAEEAIAKLKQNSGRDIAPNYIRVLVARGQVSRVKLNNRFSVYPRAEIDSYIVEAPGAKSGKASRERKKVKHAE